MDSNNSASSATKINFLPWKGENYDAGIDGCRILILGESLYHNCEEDPGCRDENEIDRSLRHSEFTRDFITWSKDNPHRSPLTYRVPLLFNLEKKDFWPKVAFYNYLQTFAGPAARVRPDEEQWDEALNAGAFQQVLDELEPDRILVLGKKLWVNLPSNPKILARRPRAEIDLPVSNDLRNYSDIDRVCFWYESRYGRPALAMPIMHPSAPRFSADEWLQPVAKWLDFGK